MSDLGVDCAPPLVDYETFKRVYVDSIKELMYFSVDAAGKNMSEIGEGIVHFGIGNGGG